MKNASFHTEDVKKTCENKLEIEFRKGKEFNGWFYLKERGVARITVAKGKKPIPPKTYQSMAKQLKLTIAQFDDLLSCPIGKEEYETILMPLLHNQTKDKRTSPKVTRRLILPDKR